LPSKLYEIFSLDVVKVQKKLLLNSVSRFENFKFKFIEVN